MKAYNPYSGNKNQIPVTPMTPSGPIPPPPVFLLFNHAGIKVSKSLLLRAHCRRVVRTGDERDTQFWKGQRYILPLKNAFLNYAAPIPST